MTAAASTEHASQQQQQAPHITSIDGIMAVGNGSPTPCIPASL
jgi:hypothetical protein